MRRLLARTANLAEIYVELLYERKRLSQKTGQPSHLANYAEDGAAPSSFEEIVESNRKLALAATERLFDFTKGDATLSKRRQERSRSLGILLQNKSSHRACLMTWKVLQIQQQIKDVGKVALTTKLGCGEYEKCRQALRG